MCSSILLQILRRNPSYICLSRYKWSFDRYKSDKKTSVSSSTILVQDGTAVQELPVIIRKIKNVLFPLENNVNSVSYTSKYTTKENDIHKLINREFKRCVTIKDVFTLLWKCSILTPNIALGALERIYDITDILQNNESLSFDPDPVINNDILDELVDIIIQNEDVYGLLRALSTVSLRSDQYLNIVCNEILERVTDNKMTIKQICDVASFFGVNKHIKKYAESLESLWIGFIQREKEFDVDSVVNSFKVLHYFQTSRKPVYGLLEKKTVLLWWQMRSGHVIDLLNDMIKCKISSSKIFPVLGRWLNTNIHAISDDVLLQVVNGFSKLGYSDQQIEKAIERFIKLKVLKVNTPGLIATLMSHVLQFRIRNITILDGCVEYFISKGKTIDSIFLKPLLYPLGYLNYQPVNGIKFWKQVEEVFDVNFSKLNSEDIIDIMQTCVYLQKYPLNFVSRVFDRPFLEKINNSQDNQRLRYKLKCLDTSLTLECKGYKGPLLPKDALCKSVVTDGRIRRLLNIIRDSFEALAGGRENMSSFVLLPNIYLTELYVVDIMFHPKGLRSSMLNLNLLKDRNVNVAVLIHTPDQLCANCETLIGPQEMRIRHLRILGLKVATLKFEILSRLRMHRIELEKYVTSRLREAQDGI